MEILEILTFFKNLTLIRFQVDFRYFNSIILRILSNLKSILSYPQTAKFGDKAVLFGVFSAFKDMIVAM